MQLRGNLRGVRARSGGGSGGSRRLDVWVGRRGQNPKLAEDVVLFRFREVVAESLRERRDANEQHREVGMCLLQFA